MINQCSTCKYTALTSEQHPCIDCRSGTKWVVAENTNINSGLNGSYYEVLIKHPTKPDKEPYLAECNDITEALNMTPHEYNIFKSVWRKAAARMGNGKTDSKALYDAQKCLFAAQRMVKIEEQNG